MKKENFVTLLLGTIGGILFALGMCMALVAEWDALIPGVIVGSVGAVVLLVMLLVRRKMQGKPRIRLNGRTVGAIALGIVGALTLGIGMCMVLVWTELMVWGIAVGLVGIVLLLCLIPLVKGLK